MKNTPPHDFPPGIFRARTKYRHVFFHFTSDVNTAWVLFNDFRNISDLKLYELNATQMSESVRKGGFITFDSITPTAKGEEAYERLKSRYPSPYHIGSVIGRDSYFKLIAERKNKEKQ